MISSTNSHRAAFIIKLVTLAATLPAQNQPLPPAGGHDADALAKEVANPVSSLISFPIQENIDFGFAGGGWRSTTNIQPVYPSILSENWKMINRAIFPVIYQGDVTHNGTDFGLGDTTIEIFFSPSKHSASGMTWGLGPVLLLPTATKDVLGTKKWSAGPAALVLHQTGKVTQGLLITHAWSFAGDNDRPYVTSTFIQPFYSYGAGKGRTYTINSETTYDWNSGEWTIPINLIASQIIKLHGNQLASIAIGGRVYLDRPHGGPDWGIRLVFQMLFPK